MNFDNWYLIKRPFRGADQKLFIVGEPVDASNWRNIDSLKNAGYICPPQTEEDYLKIKKAINTQVEREELENSSSPSFEPIRRGRPKKNDGGD